jgi:succinyl-diaminopimelate desuccinylase
MSVSALAIAQHLIRCPSVTPADAGALTYLDSLLAAHGFITHRLRFSDGNGPPIDNLYARFGTASPNLVFAGHTDVVPPGDTSRWRFDPFSGSLADDMLWGRGACDMKGGIAAAAAAVLGFLADNPRPPGSLSFLITGDEEGLAVNGTSKVLAWAKQQGETFDHCLLAEPTNPNALGDMMKIGRRGSLTGVLEVEGKQGHVAYPHLADNPIDHLIRILDRLTSEALDNGTPHFDPSNLEITTIDVGNPASNVIPGKARAVFNIRFNDRWTPSSLAEEIERRARLAAGTAHVILHFAPTNAEAFLSAPGPFSTLVGRAVHAVTGREPALSTSGGTSDARFIRLHCPVVEFGLVGKTMHAVDERVAIADLDQLTAIFRHVLEGYFELDRHRAGPDAGKS